MAGVVRLTAITEIKSTHRGQPSAYLSLTTWLVLDGCKKDRTDPVRQDQSGPPSETPGLNISDTSLYVYFLHLAYILYRNITEGRQSRSLHYPPRTCRDRVQLPVGVMPVHWSLSAPLQSDCQSTLHGI